MTFVEPGHVYRLRDVGFGTLHCLAVDTKPAPDLEDSFGALRVTLATQRHSFPDWVRFTSGDPCPGYAVVYDYERVGTEEIKENLGALSLDTWIEVRVALKRRLGL